jgi:hypothetical protein
VKKHPPFDGLGTLSESEGPGALIIQESEALNEYSGLKRFRTHYSSGTISYTKTGALPQLEFRQGGMMD